MHSRFLVVYKQKDEIYFNLISDSDFGDFDVLHDNLIIFLGQARNGSAGNYNQICIDLVDFVNNKSVKRWSVQSYTLESWPEDEIITKVVYIPELGA